MFLLKLENYLFGKHLTWHNQKRVSGIIETKFLSVKLLNFLLAINFNIDCVLGAQ